MTTTRTASSIQTLVEEYETLVHEAHPDGPPHPEADWSAIAQILERQADWTASGAEHLVWLTRDYGSFVLRNALALAAALGIEDGELGL